MQVIFAAVIITIISLATFHIANADSIPVQLNSKHDAINSMIADGLLMANQSSQQWQQKHNQSNDQQEQPLIENSLINQDNKFDNHSPSLLAQLPF
jgi:hypothetical protein